VRLLWVLCLAVFREDAWRDLRDRMDETESLILRNLGSLDTKVVQCLESRVLRSASFDDWDYRFTEYTVTVTWNDTAGFQCLPEILSDSVLGRIHPDLVLHVKHKAEDVLSCQTMQWTSQSDVSLLEKTDYPLIPAE